MIILASKIKGIPLRDAAAWLIGNTVATPQEKATAPQEHAEAGHNQLAPLAYLESDHASVVAVGFDPRIAKEFGIVYAPKGVARGNVLIPVREADGTLRGYVGLQEATFLPKDFQPPENVVPFKKKA